MDFSWRTQHLVLLPILLVFLLVSFWWTLLGDRCVEQHASKACDRPSTDRKYRCHDKPLVLLVSFDGFRWDYLQRVRNTPNLRWLVKNGVFAPQGLKNNYITITAPNHYGIVTGLNEESHGIIANTFFDPVLNKTFDYFNDGKATDPRFFLAEPLWVTNLKGSSPGAGSGCVMWLGCELPLNGYYPTYYMPYDSEVAWEGRVNALISWFKHPQKPINFGLLYIEEPDKTGHKYGPDDPAMTRMIERLDHFVGYLLFRLFSENLLHLTNLIFTADHGMASVPDTNVVNLDQYVNKTSYTVYGGSPNFNILPKPGLEEKLYQDLVSHTEHMKVYKKENIPEEYHYKRSERVMPIQVEADLHWELSKGDDDKGQNDNGTVKGAHGYNNSLTDMHPFFIAYGPMFKHGFNVSQFNSVDLYLLMCYLLNLDPLPNNGSFDTVRYTLRDEGARWDSYLTNLQGGRSEGKSEFFVTALGIDQVSLLALICFVALMGGLLYYYQRRKYAFPKPDARAAMIPTAVILEPV